MAVLARRVGRSVGAQCPGSVVSSLTVLDRDTVVRLSEGDPEAVRDVPRVRPARVGGDLQAVGRPRPGRGGRPADLRAGVVSVHQLRYDRGVGPVAGDHRPAGRHRHPSPRDPPFTPLPGRRRPGRPCPRALDELTPEEATLVRLHHLEGFSFPEIVERLDIPLGTVKSRSFRAHRRLGALLGHLRGDSGETHLPAGRAEWMPENPT
jgi:Sigma-70, region 4